MCPDAPRSCFELHQTRSEVFVIKSEKETTIHRMACERCHKAKTKCSKTIPCVRCVRLGYADGCVKHVSRQGGGVKRKRRIQTKTLTGKKKGKSDEAIITKGIPCKSTHHGMNVLLHDWILIAHRRRSFKLLSSAASLASCMGFTMDSIYSEKGLPKFANIREILPDILSKEKSKQSVCTSEGVFEALPKSMKKLLPDDFEERCVWIRHCNCGQARYWTSKEFERLTGVNSELMNDTFLKNKRSVASLYLDDKGCKNQLRALNRAISKAEVPSSTKFVGRTTSRTSIRDSRTNQLMDANCTLHLYSDTIEEMIVVMEYKVSSEQQPQDSSMMINLMPAMLRATADEEQQPLPPPPTTTTTVPVVKDAYTFFDDDDFMDSNDSAFDSDELKIDLSGYLDRWLDDST